MADPGGPSPKPPPPPTSKTDTPAVRPDPTPARKLYRGDLHIAYDVPTHGDSPDDIESKKRPVLIIQRDEVTEKRHTVVVLPLTTNLKRLSPTSSLLKKEEYGLDQDSVILCDQFFSINKDKIGGKICRLTDGRMIGLTTKYRYIVNL